MTDRVRRRRSVEERTIAKALSILESRLTAHPVFTEPREVKYFLRLATQGLAHEVFAVMYLDAKNRMIDYEQLFRGSLMSTPVYPREIAKQTLLKNAASVILHHNHPSGCCRPSASDNQLTAEIRQVLDLFDVRVLDHVITSDEGEFSMAEHCVHENLDLHCEATFAFKKTESR